MEYTKKRKMFENWRVMTDSGLRDMSRKSVEVDV